MIYKLFRRFFFWFDPETIHDGVLKFLSLPFVPKLLQFFYRYESPSLETKVFGLTFKNPVGLAAGMDKNAQALLAFQAMGFGFIEVGTVTPEPQAGNPRPRLLRFPEAQGLVNWMGFNNDGVLKVVERLRAVRKRMTIPIGLNMGKGDQTPLERAASDYERCLEVAYDVVDFFIINISSPNTPQLRDLQGEEYLSHFLSRIKTRSDEIARLSGEAPRPLLLKLSPDLTDNELMQVINVCKRQRIDGLIVTNTTTDYSLLPSHGVQLGGISGKPLRQKSTDFLTIPPNKTRIDNEIRPGDILSLECVLGVPQDIKPLQSVDAWAKVTFDSIISGTVTFETISQKEYELRSQKSSTVGTPRSYTFSDRNIQLTVTFDEAPPFVVGRKHFVTIKAVNVGNGLVDSIKPNDIHINSNVFKCPGAVEIFPQGKNFPTMACEIDIPSVSYLSQYIANIELRYSYDVREKISMSG